MPDDVHLAFCDAARLRSKLDTLRNSAIPREEDHRTLERLHALALEIMDTLDEMMFPPGTEG